MSNQSFSMNRVKEAGSNSGECILPCRYSTEQQSRAGRDCTSLKEGRGESGLKKLIEL